jgi:hypothetical protein
MQSRDAFMGEETVLLPLFLKKRIKEKMMITKLKFCFLILSSWLGKIKFFYYILLSSHKSFPFNLFFPLQISRLNEEISKKKS